MLFPATKDFYQNPAFVTRSFFFFFFPRKREKYLFLRKISTRQSDAGMEVLGFMTFCSCTGVIIR